MGCFSWLCKEWDKGIESIISIVQRTIYLKGKKNYTCNRCKESVDYLAVKHAKEIIQ